jgi:transcriptional regulator with XRE-family HTH domain
MSETFGDRLRRLREAAGLSVAQLAAEAETSATIVGELEAERRQPTRLWLEAGLRIALALDVDPYDLAFGEHHPKGYRAK